MLGFLFKMSRILITLIYITNCVHVQTPALSPKTCDMKESGTAREIAVTDLEICGLIILCALKGENH